MTVILLEALGALLILALIVWWTMFAGRNKGELPGHHDQADEKHEKQGEASQENPPPKS
ncbi:hypothetical protein [Ottowia thiooxydans]|uniref:hypothetical protein n=1 Tax=Ottowia thiooxydans TaxID=219182 RepID=UPI000416CADE|nr:hypothetical protein [Ottowia thiooxydans]